MIIKTTPNQSEKHRAYTYNLIISKSQVSTNNYETGNMCICGSHSLCARNGLRSGQRPRTHATHGLEQLEQVPVQR